ncbi:MAG: aminoacyl-histidine dipeptidase [Firmicutes bacterium HGW-Firmicutes-16]|nr:MAG: aminoacyl-histidine dipeptidase [Firmicutes bacterium HGW-Firmicutes-16]
MTDAKKVFNYFEEISRIPRESGDEKAIAAYLVGFAKDRGLEVYSDSHSNVIIKKPSTVPNCACAPVIIQGHTDMVYVRDDNCKIAYEDGIGLIYKDGWLMADGTTLGADDGIAVAYALALLDTDDIVYPDLEAVFTTGEEIGCLGVGELDFGLLKGKYVINLDTEEEGVFFTSCAGAFRNNLSITIERETVSGHCPLTVKIYGLLGGHSGGDIHLGKANGIMLMSRILSELGDKVRISSLEAVGKTNAISTNATAELFVEKAELEGVENLIKQLQSDFRHEYGNRDNVSVELSSGDIRDGVCYTCESQKRIVSALSLLPNGVLGMSFEIADLVESSSNPGFIEQKDNELIIHSLARSSVGSRKTEAKEKFAAIAALTGGASVCSAEYPQWEYRAKSPLRELAMETYKELFKIEAKALAIHAGLECGFFDKMLESVDIISYGPELQDIHTPKERADIASIERIWTLTLSILEKLARQA